MSAAKGYSLNRQFNDYCRPEGRGARCDLAAIQFGTIITRHPDAKAAADQATAFISGAKYTPIGKTAGMLNPASGRPLGALCVRRLRYSPHGRRYKRHAVSSTRRGLRSRHRQADCCSGTRVGSGDTITRSAPSNRRWNGQLAAHHRGFVHASRSCGRSSHPARFGFNSFGACLFVCAQSSRLRAPRIHLRRCSQASLSRARPRGGTFR